MPLPLISVVTICRNAKATIYRTIESVRACGYPNLQYIVVDGASTDGTQSIVESFGSDIDLFISEPDRGIADAMNKGIVLSNGEFHHLLHADDELLPGALDKLALAVSDGTMVACGSSLVMDGTKLVRRYRAQPSKLLQKMALPHMGCIVRKTAWQEVGGYDPRLRIAMDHLFMLRILKRYGLGAFSTVDDVIAKFNVGGVSDLSIYEGFGEVRSNLLEEGYGALAANRAFLVLCAKGLISRQLR